MSNVVKDTRKLILDCIEDAVVNLLFYDRKEDEELSEEAIENAFTSHTISIDDAVHCFRMALINGLEWPSDA